VSLTNQRITALKRIIQSNLVTTGIIRYNITYVPKLNAYKITLVGSREGMSGSTLYKLIDSLSTNGFTVWVKISRIPVYNIVILYAVPKVFPY